MLFVVIVRCCLWRFGVGRCVVSLLLVFVVCCLVLCADVVCCLLLGVVCNCLM